mmetsp:Transcript_28064/g.65578  ORF Transcript_28064/g.65578 Transcript_28064/m.65578 type:complete len:168 (-) Transcript_28064:64-567(-)|eukprot:CAMPEP_0171107588 /NCGR_PEP_ID=MMETSP0766_2-20121228/67146_1 /TAXON_ID=439317 /ORGANISM="Gambierdiscus australes, Strain CAWD 149" /LENGTH=167 /DNA_ID=CAMNT_0011568931 /DNA_START=62 /DNA_END=565 /DNA_ORIENTATION=+
MACSRSLLLVAALCSSAAGWVQPSAHRPAPVAEVGVAHGHVVGDATFEVERKEAVRSTWWPLAFGAALGLMVAVGTPAAYAADLANGENVFNGICAACHAGGENLVVSEKKLNKDALSKFGALDLTKIKAIIAGGQGAMPALGQALEASDIDDVANYVLAQSEKGWK